MIHGAKLRALAEFMIYEGIHKVIEHGDRNNMGYKASGYEYTEEDYLDVQAWVERKLGL